LTEADRIESMRTAAREVLRELLPEMLDGERATGTDAVVPLVPAPPVAAVMRPSTWTAPAGPGEIIGDEQTGLATERGATGAADPAAQPASQPAAQTASQPASPPAPAPDGARTEAVTLDSDADLQRFVASLLTRFENPGQRRALRAGRLRFTLRRAPDAPAPHAGRATPAMRVDKGAVTERIVREAAAAGARLVLARGAVLTPLARDQARTLRVGIEREDT
jgi:hypothetical protein